jgi:hypothetical protein
MLLIENIPPQRHGTSVTFTLPRPLRWNLFEHGFSSSQLKIIYSDFLKMTEVTRLEARYVDNAKLDTLLQQLFGRRYSVKVSSMTGPIIVSLTIARLQVMSLKLRHRDYSQR